MTPDYFPSHPAAQTAVLMASVNTPDRHDVDRVLRETGTPRALYTLARVLRAAQHLDEIEAMDRAMPRIRYDANAFGPGLAGILIDHAEAA